MECQSSCMGDKDHVCGGGTSAISLYSTSLGKCGCRYKSDEGYIVSPGFPGSYDDNIECEWTVTVSRGKAVKLTFFKMNLLPYKSVLDILDNTVTTTSRITVLDFNEWFSLSEEISVTLLRSFYKWFGSGNEDDTSNGFVIQFQAVSKCNASGEKEVLPQRDIYYEGDMVNMTQLCGDSVVTNQFICTENGEWMVMETIQNKCREATTSTVNFIDWELMSQSSISMTTEENYDFEIHTPKSRTITKNLIVVFVGGVVIIVVVATLFTMIIYRNTKKRRIKKNVPNVGNAASMTVRCADTDRRGLGPQTEQEIQDFEQVALHETGEQNAVSEFQRTNTLDDYVVVDLPENIAFEAGPRSNYVINEHSIVSNTPENGATNHEYYTINMNEEGHVIGGEVVSNYASLDQSTKELSHVYTSLNSEF